VLPREKCSSASLINLAVIASPLIQSMIAVVFYPEGILTAPILSGGKHGK